MTTLLRHTFAINFLRNGGGVFALQSILGHSSLEMTRRYCQAMGFEDVVDEHARASPIDKVLRSRESRPGVRNSFEASLSSPLPKGL